MCPGQAEGINLGSGSFQEGETIFESVGFLQSGWRRGQLLHQRNGEPFGGALLLKEAEQCGRARHECRSDTHGMGQIKETALKPSILLQSGVEELSPATIGKITIDLDHGGIIERAADRMSLDDTAVDDEVGMIVPHAVLVSRGPHERREAKRHVITKVN